MKKNEMKKELIVEGSKIIMSLASDVILNSKDYSKKEAVERLDLIFHLALTFESILESNDKKALEKFYISNVFNYKEVK